MKNLIILNPNERLHDPVLEDHIQKRDKELKEQAIKNARHYAKSNQPRINDENLEPFIGDLKRGYEKTGAEVNQKLQTSSQFSDAKMEADYYKAKDGELETEIESLTAQNHNDELLAGDVTTSDVPKRILWILIFSICLFVGEVAYNTNALQVIGETLIFSLFIAITITVAILLLAHFTSHLFKVAKTSFRRKAVIAGSVSLATIVFIGLGILRSAYLKNHGADVNPIFFVVFNLLFYVVALLLSFFVYPTREEVLHYRKCLEVLKQIKKRTLRIEACKTERENIKREVLEKAKMRMRIIHYSNSLMETIRKMYKEAVEIFKSHNLLMRTDRKTPSCFLYEIPEPEIAEISNYFLNRKAS
jgi:cation transport ATPase